MAAAEETVATSRCHVNGISDIICLFNINKSKSFFLTTKHTHIFDLSISVLYSIPMITVYHWLKCIQPSSLVVTGHEVDRNTKWAYMMSQKTTGN